MPKLDGVSATSLIRQFDHMTPIISMTSNSKPNEIMTYYSSGTFTKNTTGFYRRFIVLLNRNERYSTQTIYPNWFIRDTRGRTYPVTLSLMILNFFVLETSHAS